jgi:sigma-B regulation protein RsbU (phosphoserine phosphatase)
MVSGVILQQDRRALEKRRAEQMTTELHIGQTVQQLMVPLLPPNLPGLQLALRMVAAQTVSGDLVELQASPEKLLIAVADVEGVGLGPALQAVTLRSFMRAGFDHTPDLGAAVNWISDIWNKESRVQASRVVGLFLNLNLQTRAIDWVCAGGVWGILLHADGAIEHLYSTRVAIGVEDPSPTIVRQTQMRAGDLLAIFTSGLPYGRDGNGQVFEEGRVIDLLRTHQSEPAETIAEALLSAHRTFIGDTPQDDDTTLLIVKAELDVKTEWVSTGQLGNLLERMSDKT